MSPPHTKFPLPAFIIIITTTIITELHTATSQCFSLKTVQSRRWLFIRNLNAASLSSVPTLTAAPPPPPPPPDRAQCHFLPFVCSLQFTHTGTQTNQSSSRPSDQSPGRLVIITDELYFECSELKLPVESGPCCSHCMRRRPPCRTQ